MERCETVLACTCFGSVHPTQVAQVHDIHTFRKPAKVTRHTFSTGNDYPVSFYFGKAVVAYNSQKKSKARGGDKGVYFKQNQNLGNRTK